MGSYYDPLDNSTVSCDGDGFEGAIDIQERVKDDPEVQKTALNLLTSLKALSDFSDGLLRKNQVFDRFGGKIPSIFWAAVYAEYYAIQCEMQGDKDGSMKFGKMLDGIFYDDLGGDLRFKDLIISKGSSDVFFEILRRMREYITMSAVQDLVLKNAGDVMESTFGCVCQIVLDENPSIFNCRERERKSKRGFWSRLFG